jgi:hypothetical protein
LPEKSATKKCSPDKGFSHDQRRLVKVAKELFCMPAVCLCWQKRKKDNMSWLGLRESMALYQNMAFLLQFYYRGLRKKIYKLTEKFCCAIQDQHEAFKEIVEQVKGVIS